MTSSTVDFRRGRLPRWPETPMRSPVFSALLLLSVTSPTRQLPAQLSVRMSADGNDGNPGDGRGGRDVCETNGCVQSAASVLANMDDSVRPCDDFYQFACGKFTRDAHIDDDQTSRTTYSAVNDKIVEKLHRLLESPQCEQDLRHVALVKRLYGMCMDVRRLNERGVGPLLDLIAGVGGWPLLSGDLWNGDGFRWTDSVYRFRELGLSVDYFVELSVKVDRMHTSEYIVELDHAIPSFSPLYLRRGLGDMKVNSYYRYMVNVAVALGANRTRAEVELRKSLEFEVCLARISQFQSIEYTTVRELSARYPGVPWYEYINRLMCGDGQTCVRYRQRVIVNMPGYLSGLAAALASTDSRVLANYMVWRAVASCVPFADRRLRDLQQALHAELYGQPTRQPRWAECVEVVSAGLYLAVGRLYVTRYFDGRTKNATADMVKKIRREMHDVLLNSDWMDSVTKKYALDKAEAIEEFVAYPDELLDERMVDGYYSALSLDDGDYLGTMLRLSGFECDKYFERLHVPVNKSDWVTHGRAVVLNAFYNIVENSIQFPAGILQGMFFSADRPNYMNFGSIGYVIGHEITHGFDDKGRMYDKTGSWRNWWRRETSKKFTERALCMVRQYNGFQMAGQNVNGMQTLDENIADNGGVMLAYRAYSRWSAACNGGPEPRLPGLDRYTPRQMFWISSANVWCSVYRPDTIRKFLQTNQHSPGRFRVIGSFQNQREFAEDFRCPVGSYMNPEKKCKVW